MTYETRKRMAEHYLSLDTKGKKRQKNLVKYVAEYDQEEKDIDIAYSDMTKAQLKEACDGARIEYASKATNDDLIVLLENASDETPEEEPSKPEPQTKDLEEIDDIEDITDLDSL